jgi:hypothetical protein
VRFDLAAATNVRCDVGIALAPLCPSGLVHRFGLDADLADTETDLVATCSVDGCPSFVDDGLARQAASFDGVGLDVDSSSVDWDGAQSFTVSYWIRRDPAVPMTVNEVVVGREETAVHWWTGVWESGDRQGKASFVLLSSLSQSEDEHVGLTGTTVVNDGQWHMVTAVHDAEHGEVRLYVDGRLEDFERLNYDGDFAADTPLQLGYLSDWWWFYGQLDELAIFDRALPDAVIRAILNQGNNGAPICR